MRAAIYVRKSNEERDGKGDGGEHKSVRRQEEHGREYAKRKGWTVVEVFSDDGISGAEFAGRPGYVRLMTAAVAKPRPFDVLVMSEESRLGREMIEVSYAVKTLIVAGIRIFYYLEDRERTLDSPIEKAVLALQTMADEMEQAKARLRATDASRQCASHGCVSGNRLYGYVNVRSETGRVVREIDPATAAIVRRVFEMAAAGKGFRKIAQALNAEGCPSPRAHGFTCGTVRGLLGNAHFIGQVTSDKKQKRDRWGRVNPSRKPENSWMKIDAPHLRMISDELWTAAHERLAASRETYLRCHEDGRFCVQAEFRPGEQMFVDRPVALLDVRPIDALCKRQSTTAEARIFLLPLRRLPPEEVRERSPRAAGRGRRGGAQYLR